MEEQLDVDYQWRLLGCQWNIIIYLVRKHGAGFYHWVTAITHLGVVYPTLQQRFCRVDTINGKSHASIGARSLHISYGNISSSSCSPFYDWPVWDLFLHQGWKYNILYQSAHVIHRLDGQHSLKYRVNICRHKPNFRPLWSLTIVIFDRSILRLFHSLTIRLCPCC